MVSAAVGITSNGNEMPSCEYCGCRVSANSYEDSLSHGRIYYCSKEECTLKFSDLEEAEKEELNSAE